MNVQHAIFGKKTQQLVAHFNPTLSATVRLSMCSGQYIYLCNALIIIVYTKSLHISMLVFHWLTDVNKEREEEKITFERSHKYNSLIVSYLNNYWSLQQNEKKKIPKDIC